MHAHCNAVHNKISISSKQTEPLSGPVKSRIKMGKEADRLLRRMAERMSIMSGENYSSVVSFLRRRFRFDLLKTCVIAMRGYKKPTTTAAKIDTLDLDLRTTASSC